SCAPRWTTSCWATSSSTRARRGRSPITGPGRRSFSLTDSTDKAQPRRTALVVAVVLGLAAAWCWYLGGLTWAAGLGVGAAVLVLVGLCWPAGARRFHDLWMRGGAVLGWVNSRLILTLLFYTVFTLYGGLSRLFGRDPLHRRGVTRPSYWVPRKGP